MKIHSLQPSTENGTQVKLGLYGSSLQVLLHTRLKLVTDISIYHIPTGCIAVSKHQHCFHDICKVIMDVLLEALYHLYRLLQTATVVGWWWWWHFLRGTITYSSLAISP